MFEGFIQKWRWVQSKWCQSGKVVCDVGCLFAGCDVVVAGANASSGGVTSRSKFTYKYVREWWRGQEGQGGGGVHIKSHELQGWERSNQARDC